VAKELKESLKLDKLEVTYVEVGATDRLKAIVDGKADLLCEATTVTLSRLNQVDFSLGTFVTGGSLLYRVDGPSTFEQLAGKKVGVLAGTTTEANLETALKKAGINADVVEVADHESGIDKLGKGEIEAYFADRAILVYLYLNSPVRDQLKLAAVTLSLEPYALALPKGDRPFRVAVDTALARFYRAGGGEALFKASFPGAEMPDIIHALYVLNSLPE
jgi:polar amino acid transport system substrate-binding protein/glutamate/aspartate transport system substrate-binding protein